MTQVSIIIPVRNEENLILPAIEGLRVNDALLPTEIIIVDGGSHDRTVELAEKSADQVIRSPKGSRSFQMHLGAQHAQGTFLVFLHIDSQFPPHWQNILINSFIKSRHPPAAASFNIGFDSNKPFFRILAALANWRSKITRIPHGDQALIVSKENYFRCGGFPDVPLMEEYLLLPCLNRLGRIDIYPDTATTSARKYTAKGPLRNALKNSLLIFLFYLGVSPKQLAKWY